MSRCLLCDGAVDVFLDFGPMPVANGFLPPDAFATERFRPLRVGVCASCEMVQLIDTWPPAALFNANYAYFASTSRHMEAHFKKMAGDIDAHYLLQAKDPFVVEIGSNDGITLQHFRKYRHLGVDPSANVAAAAARKGLDIVSAFFTKDFAKDIVAGYGQADVVIATNVLCHLANLPDVLDGIRLLLKPGGRLVAQDPCFHDVLAKTAYDQIYDEHLFYFTKRSLADLLRAHGLVLHSTSHEEVHGGSLRYVVAHQGAPEAPLDGFITGGSIDAFRQRVFHSRDTLLDRLWRAKRSGKRIVGYGATSKSTTVTNFCPIGPDLVGCIQDVTPFKQGKCSPGVHIPIVADAKVHPTDDAYLLFAWNHGAEIKAKEKDFKGEWIEYV